MHSYNLAVEARNIPYSWKCLQGTTFCSLRFWQDSANISAKIFGTHQSREVSAMFPLRYFSRTSSLPSSGSIPSLIPEALHKANKSIASLSIEPDEASLGSKSAKNTYSSYSAEDPARMGRYAAEHRPTKAS